MRLPFRLSRAALIVAFVAAPAAATPFYRITDLGGVPGGSGYSIAYGINSAGQVVGDSAAATGTRPFLWQSGSGMVDLNTLVDPTDPLYGFFTLGTARSINDEGQIVGWGINASSATHAFLLTPVPLPAAAWLLLSGLGVLGVVARTRPR